MLEPEYDLGIVGDLGKRFAPKESGVEFFVRYVLGVAGIEAFAWEKGPCGATVAASGALVESTAKDKARAASSCEQTCSALYASPWWPKQSTIHRSQGLGHKC